jgi:hypothetical protein
MSFVKKYIIGIQVMNFMKKQQQKKGPFFPSQTLQSHLHR